MAAMAPGSRIGRMLRATREFLPQGRALSDASWRARHRVILVVLWMHAVAIPVYGVVTGHGTLHGVLDGGVVIAAALVAGQRRLGRRFQAVAATFGLLSSSAVLVHLSGGLIEMHFHFFVMVPLVALYQDWSPFLTAISYVLVHHGALGAISPSGVYNHPAAQANPWGWAAIHAFFIAGISAVCLTTWRLNENAMRDQRSAEDELRDALSLVNATLESTADGILVVNNTGAITRFNERFVEVWGIPSDVLESRDDERAIAYVLDQLEDPDAFVAKVRELYDDPDAESLDELRFKDGRTLERSSKPQRVGERAVGRVWSFRDITQRKRAEQTLLDAHAKDLAAIAQLEALDEAKNRFLSAVSHELRTPLVSVVGFAHTLRDLDGELTAAQKRGIVERLTRNAERLQRLLLDIFDLDRLSRGILEPRRQRTDLAELVRNVVADVAVPDHPMRVDVEPVTAWVDPAMIERVIENLVANAFRHTPDGTPVGLRLSTSGSDVLLVVEDEGDGVPDDLKGSVFEPFKQGKPRPHAPGTGIGLALVAQFVELHGGTAWVDDRPGGGARFHVRFPRDRRRTERAA